MENVSKEYKTGAGSFLALSDVNFELNEGEFVIILGPSGAGKTTLLNLLGGMDDASGGLIKLDGQVVSSLNKKQLTQYRREKIGFVFQFYNLMPNLTALENVELATEICPDALNPEQTLENVGLGDKFKNFPAQLSGGEQQRVSIARAIAKNPKLLLCDEPTGALDSKNSKLLMQTFELMNRELGSTILMVTHDALVGSYASRVLFLKDGKIWSELVRGNRDRHAFYSEILSVTSALGGDSDAC